MARIPNVNRKRILLVCCGISLLLAVTFALTVKTHSQQLQVLDQKTENAALEEVERSVDQPMRVLGNVDSPFRIVEARVKEVSGEQFTRLTGRTTDLVTVSTVPEIELVNTSGKAITGFVIGIRDPHSRTTRTLAQRKVSIAPGETYIVRREHFVNPQQVTVADDNGQFHQKLVQPKKNSEKYWLPFAGRSDIFVTVGCVNFDDGTTWMIKKGGEVK